MVTIKDIAEMVGVSPTTVSNVIHGNSKKVSKENIERISKALQETNYVKRLGLNALKQRESKIVGVVIHSSKKYEHTILADPFYGQLVGELEKGIREAGYYMMFYAAENIEDIVRMAMAWNVDGLIAITFSQDDYGKLREFVDKPIVAIDLIKNTCEGFYNVGLDDWQGGYIMTKYILQQGIRKVFILATRDAGVDHNRFLGYKAALEEFNVEYKPEQFIKLSDNSEKRKGDIKYLKKFAGKGIALFFLSDTYALEAINCFQSEGIKIPEELSVAGFDNSVVNEYASMKITTIHQDIGGKAQKALEVLRKLIAGSIPEENDIKLPVYLIAGESIKRAIG